MMVLGGVWTKFHCAPFSKCPWSKCTGKNCTDKIRKATITMVGARDEASYWNTIISDFKEYEKNERGLEVTVEYEKLDQENYEDILFDRQLNKKGPNIFLMFNTWLSKYQQRIVPMPDGMMTLAQFEKYFPQVAENDLATDGKIYSLPLYVDTLALFYNKDMLYNAGISRAPETWAEFETDVEKMTMADKDGKVERLGAAIGGSKLVDRSPDVVMLMVMQNNLKADNPTKNLASFLTPEATQAVKFYTDFADPAKKAYTWNDSTEHYSLDTFIELRSAMSINYSYQIANLKNKTGKAFNYGVAPVPQQYPNDKINYANYWAPVVAKGADCAKEEGVTASCEDISWDFISFAAQAKNAKSYIEASGRPAANLELAQQQAGEDGSDLSVFANQILTAKSWKNIDNNKNDEVLMKMIDTIISSKDKDKKNVVDAAMKTALGAIKELN